jgi:hypothetical protein
VREIGAGATYLGVEAGVIEGGSVLSLLSAHVIEGAATLVDAETMTGGDVTARAEVDRISAGGQLTGVKLGRLGGAAPAPATAPAAPASAVPPTSPAAPAPPAAGVLGTKSAPPLPAAAGPTCAGCGAALAPGAKFCAACGTPVPAGPRFCAQCGAELGGGAKFCAQCGTPTGG